jgi:hypothetical protein
VSGFVGQYVIILVKYGRVIKYKMTERYYFGLEDNSLWLVDEPCQAESGSSNRTFLARDAISKL